MDQDASSIDQVRDALRSACVISVDGHAFAVFFKGELQLVVGLNPSAEILVRLVESGRSPETLVADYAAVLDIPSEVADQFVSMISEDWANMGILGPDVPKSESLKPGDAVAPPRGNAPFDSVVSIGGAAIRMVLHDAGLAKLTAPMVAGNTVPNPPAKIFTINAWKNGKTWHVADSGGKSETVTSIEVARDRTLARLMANSWPKLSDAPCIHGAALGGLYPELARQDPIDVNGRLCKYVQRPAFDGPETSHGVDALIFPNWQEGAEAKLAPFDKQSSLLSMLRWSYLPQHQKNLQAMADFLGSLPLYELTYSRFEDADRMLMDLLECPN